MAGLFERRDAAEQLVRQWQDAWNAHDVERVLGSFSPDFTYVTYFAEQLVAASDGRVVGRDAVAKLLRIGFALIPNLQFDVELVSVGMFSLILHLRSEKGVAADTVLLFNRDGQIREAHAHYPR